MGLSLETRKVLLTIAVVALVLAIVNTPWFSDYLDLFD